MKLRCLIIEDEPLSQDVIINYIKECPSLELVNVCHDAFAANEVIRSTPVDLLFLDINLPGLSGIRFIRTLTQPVMVIFTTAYPEFAVEGFETDAIDYLVKPFSFERFLKAVNKALKEAKYLQERSSGKEDKPSAEPGFILVKADKKVYRINFSDIGWIEAIGDYVKVVTHEKSLLTHETLKNMTEQLPEDLFTQVHKSYVVNMQKIQYIEGNQIKIMNNLIPIGLVFKENLMKRLNLNLFKPGPDAP
jgi:DNA-binding LytR/AlgR family response regulator